MDFWRAVEILGKRKWLILLSVVVATVLTFGATRLVGSRWMASVKFFAPQPSSVVPQADDPSAPPRPDSLGAAREQALIYTQIVKTKEVLGPALAKAGMTQLPEDVLNNIKFDLDTPRTFS